MSVNSFSSTSNASLPPPPLSPSLYIELFNCFCTTAGVVSVTAFTLTSILLLLPLYIFVLYLGLQRWRQQRPGSTMSHSDLLTYHMVAIEIISVFGYTLTCVGVHTNLPQIMYIGSHFFSVKMSGQMFFHVLTCVERYLAVVHPIAYLSLRKASGIRFRNIIIGCAWLLSFAKIGLIYVTDECASAIINVCTCVFILAIVCFCSVSVLYVLIHPGPGEGGGSRRRVDQSKLRAFHTIMTILGVLGFRFVANIVSSTLYAFPQIGPTKRCALFLSVSWYSLPSSLVLPLLFLHKVEKLPCCKTSEPGPD